MRAYQDLREFLAVLEQERQLLRIIEQVAPEPDLAAAACELTQLGEASPAIHFSNISGYTNARLVMNVHGSWPNHALALGMEKDAPPRDQFLAFVKRYQKYPGELERVADAPWQEVVVEKDVNLYDLMPLFRVNRGDGGYFIDKPCVISRDPDDWDNDDVENVGVYRLQVKGRNRIGIQTVPQHDIAIQLAHAEARGEDLPVAIALGNEPTITLIGGTPMSERCCVPHSLSWRCAFHATPPQSSTAHRGRGTRSIGGDSWKLAEESENLRALGRASLKEIDSVRC